jgi:hypothetical protein
VLAFGELIVIVAVALDAGSRLGLIVTLISPAGQPPEVHGTPLPTALPAGGVTTRNPSDEFADHDSNPVPVLLTRIRAVAWSGVPFVRIVTVLWSTLSRGFPSSRLATFLTDGACVWCAGLGVGMSMSRYGNAKFVSRTAS